MNFIIDDHLGLALLSVYLLVVRRLMVYIIIHSLGYASEPLEMYLNPERSTPELLDMPLNPELTHEPVCALTLASRLKISV